jgi:hypothetical protein
MPRTEMEQRDDTMTMPKGETMPETEMEDNGK